MKKFVFSFVFFYFASLVYSSAQPSEYKMSRKEYIERYKDEAIHEMNQHKIPASITLAQALLESNNGNSALATYANNHFGIKCHSDWQGPSYIQDDDKKNECFKKYPSVLDSYTDHSLFLKKNRYAKLFELKITDYKGWAKGLKEAGYATDPNYPAKLIKLIEDNQLYQYDQLANLSSSSSSSSSHFVNNIPTQSNAFNPKRAMGLFNGIKYIQPRDGDSFFKISQEVDIELWQLYKYNDLTKGDKLVPGEKIYLQPKKRKAQDEYHIVKKGETMRSISQLHGVKTKHLQRKNHMKPWDEPKVGDKIWLKNKKKN